MQDNYEKATTHCNFQLQFETITSWRSNGYANQIPESMYRKREYENVDSDFIRFPALSSTVTTRKLEKKLHTFRIFAWHQRSSLVLKKTFHALWNFPWVVNFKPWQTSGVRSHRYPTGKWAQYSTSLRLRRIEIRISLRTIKYLQELRKLVCCATCITNHLKCP
jgi:hypothetical protein